VREVLSNNQIAVAFGIKIFAIFINKI